MWFLGIMTALLVWNKGCVMYSNRIKQLELTPVGGKNVT